MAATFQSDAFQIDSFESSVDVTATPSGVAAVSAVGTVTVIIDVVASPAGVEAASSLGIVIAVIDVVAAPAGVEAAGSVGTVTATGTVGSFKHGSYAVKPINRFATTF